MNGVIAAGNAVTAEAGAAILRAGGNAYDAAVAAVATACVAEPVLSSLGGGGFLLSAQPGQPAVLYDFFARTPGRRPPADELEFEEAFAEFGTTRQAFRIGRGSVAVPGLVRGLFTVHRDLCTMPMEELLAPAVTAARDGIAVDALQASIFRVVQSIYTATPGARAVYGSPEREGDMVGEGEVLRQPDLAHTLEAIGREGDALFHEGELARLIVEEQRDHGALSLDDLRSYEVKKREPLTFAYGDSTVSTNPAPSSGGLLMAFGFRLLEEAGIDLAEFPFGSVQHVDVLARVLRATSEARLRAQELSGDGPLEADILLDPHLLAAYREDVARRLRAPGGTTHVSVIDGAGGVASVTVSNGEGCGHVLPGTGVMLNNMLGEDDLHPQGFHQWEPNERLTSMMAPTIVRRPGGDLVATGSGGSKRIRSAVLQVLISLLDFGMTVDEAVNAPRLHHGDGLLSIEDGFDLTALAPVLEAHEHQVWNERSLFFGGAHTVLSTGGRLEGAGDPRRGGRCLVV